MHKKCFFVYSVIFIYLYYKHGNDTIISLSAYKEQGAKNKIDAPKDFPAIGFDIFDVLEKPCFTKEEKRGKIPEIVAQIKKSFQYFREQGNTINGNYLQEIEDIEGKYLGLFQRAWINISKGDIVREKQILLDDFIKLEKELKKVLRIFFQDQKDIGKIDDWDFLKQQRKIATIIHDVFEISRNTLFFYLDN